MVGKVTYLNNLKGIRISTNSFFIKKIYLKNNIKYLFRNIITISNKSKNTIQIIFGMYLKIIERSAHFAGPGYLTYVLLRAAGGFRRLAAAGCWLPVAGCWRLLLQLLPKMSRSCKYACGC